MVRVFCDKDDSRGAFEQFHGAYEPRVFKVDLAIALFGGGGRRVPRDEASTRKSNIS